MIKTDRNVIPAVIVLGLVMLCTVFIGWYPDWNARMHIPKNATYTGQASWFDPWDINVYINAVRSGQHDGLLLANHYTTVPNKPILMYPLYTLTGHLFPSADPFVILNTLSASTAVLLVAALYVLSGMFFSSWRMRVITVCITLFGGGFGFFSYPNGSPDLSMTSFTFASALQRPHEALGVIGYLSVMTAMFVLAEMPKGRWYRSVTAAAAMVVMAVIYPYMMLIVVGMAVFLVAANRQRHFAQTAVPLGVLCALGTATVLFVRQQFALNPTYSGVFNQHLPTPAIWWLLFGYGVIVPAAFLGAFRRMHMPRIRFLAVWVLLGIAMAYLPLGIARFYLRGLMFPLAVLVMLGVRRVASRLSVAPFPVGLVLVIAVIPSSAYIFFRRLGTAGTDNPWYYLSRNESGAVSYLKRHDSPPAGVLAFYHMGNEIPAFTDDNVYMGHTIQTPDAQTKKDTAMRFYTYRMSDPEALSFLRDNRIRYVYWGTEEAVLTNTAVRQDQATPGYPFLHPVYSTSDVVLYELKQ